jgi:parvulin-like peptidyl-prolyl isomerase
MATRKTKIHAGKPWRRSLLLIAFLALAVAGVSWAQQVFRVSHPDKLTSTPAPSSPAGVPRNTPRPTSDYSRRVVAYLFDTEPVTREALGEFLIARRGADKLQLLVNKRIIEDACREHGIEVTAAEVEAALASNLQEARLTWETFESAVKTRYKRSMYEWKEDVVRPRLLLTKLSRAQVRVSNAEVERLFVSRFGEKVQGRLIVYPLEEKQKALAEYNQLRDSEKAFAERAGHQANSKLSGTKGKVKPFGRYVMGDDAFDKAVFRLQPGEVSELIHTDQGLVLFKCDTRIPPNRSVSLNDVQVHLGAEIREQKVQAMLQNLFQGLSDKADPKVYLVKADKVEGGVKYVGPGDPTPHPSQVVAVYHGDRTVTREELGEFLIVRYGPQKVEELVNHHIIDRACQKQGITVSEKEIELSLEQDLKALNLDEKGFLKRLLEKYDKNLYEWKYDEIRPRLQLRKLCQHRVQVTEEDLQRAFTARHGEKVQGRLILWPQDQMKFALAQYAQIRDDEDAFREAAKHQPSPTLSARGGRIEPFGRYSLGDDNLEREALRLQPGEVTTLVGTAQGYAVFKCDARIPARTDISLKDAKVRAELTELVRRKKVEFEMRVVFKELRDQANPRVMLKNPNTPIDLTAETRKALEDSDSDSGGPK